MTNLKVSDVNMDTGAADLKLIFGDKYKTTNVDIDAGASSIDMVIPKGSGAKIKIDGVLKNANVKNLGWVRQGDYYISPNYDSAENKINVNVDMGVGNFNIDMK